MSERFLPGGYQGPQPGHGAVSPKRGHPIVQEGPIGRYRVRLQVVPLEGGRPDWWQVEEAWEFADTGGTGTATCPIVGRDLAMGELARRVAHYRAGGQPPE